MKVTTLGPVVLTGQGGSGSFSVGVPSSTPGVGPVNGDIGNDDVTVPITNPGNENYGSEADEALPMHLAEGIPPAATPAPSAAQTDGAPSHEPVSQYSTQGPIPKG